MKPEFSKPFDVVSAKAGAPFSGDLGEKMHLLLWDRKYPGYPIIMMEEDGDQEVIAFRLDGSTGHGNGSLVQNLVMLPLGLIDGKPVFVGDAIEDGGDGDWTPGVAHPANRDFKNCRWPAPVPVYPVTRMDGLALAVIQAAAREDMASPCIAVANAAIARCFADGDAVLPDVHANAVEKAFDEGIKMGEKSVASDRLTRDMAIARAVITACKGRFDGESRACCSTEFIIARLSGVHLKAAIASVTP